MGGGYVAAIGREGQLPPLLAEMVERGKAQGFRAEAELLFDGDEQYIGYRVKLIRDDLVIHSVEVTGAASRFPPWELPIDGDVNTLKERLRDASDLDAPPEGGNFDGGFVASATQAARYRGARRAGETR